MVIDRRTSMHVIDIHERTIPRSQASLFADLVAIGTPEDRTWPEPRVPFHRTPGPLVVGVSRASHGAIQTILEEYQPDQKMVWRATVSFLRGTHGFELRRIDDTTTQVVHRLDIVVPFWFAPVWRFRIARIHTRIVEALLDRLAGADRRAAPVPGTAAAAADPVRC
jgi:hypothetical protein